MVKRLLAALLAACLLCGPAALAATPAHRLTALQQEWEDTLPGLQMQLNHEDTDELTLAMRTLEAGIRTQSAPLCALGCTQMEESAQHLSHRDAFNWANIL